MGKGFAAVLENYWGDLVGHVENVRKRHRNIVDNNQVHRIFVDQIVDEEREYLEAVGHCTVVHIVGSEMVKKVQVRLQMVAVRGRAQKVSGLP